MSGRKKTHSERTLRTYADRWEAFVSWCIAREKVALPSTPTTIIQFMSYEHKRGISCASIYLHLSAISHYHLSAGIALDLLPTDSPEVRQVYRAFKAQHADDPHLTRPLNRVDLATILGRISHSERLIDKRDRALFSIGFWGAYPRSALVSITCRDVEIQPNAIKILADRTTTTLNLTDDPTMCAVRACACWFIASQIQDGPLFRHVDRHGNVVGDQALTGRAFADTLKLQARRAGVDPTSLSGHSLRLGFAIEIAVSGLPAHVHMELDRRVSLARTGLDALKCRRPGALPPGED